MDTPFVYDHFVTGRNFIGRKTECTILGNLIAQGENVAIVLPPKGGKSSIIQQTLFQLRVGGMPSQTGQFSVQNIREKEKFLQRWAEHNPGSETIAAEYENTFDLRDRAVRFMTWWNRNNQTRTATPAQQPTRSDRFAEGMKRLDALFDGYGKAAHPVDEQ